MVSFENRVIVGAGVLAGGWLAALVLLREVGLAPGWLFEAASPFFFVALIAVPQSYLAVRGEEPVTVRRGLAAFVSALVVAASTSSLFGSDVALLAGVGTYVGCLVLEGYLGYRATLRGVAPGWSG